MFQRLYHCITIFQNPAVTLTKGSLPENSFNEHPFTIRLGEMAHGWSIRFFWFPVTSSPMITKTILLASAFALFAVPVQADERYKVIRPVIIESGIAGEWMMQLSGPERARVLRKVERPTVQYRTVRRAGLFSRKDECALREVHFARDARHLVRGEADRVRENCELIPRQRRVGEHVVLKIASGGGHLYRCLIACSSCSAVSGVTGAMAVCFFA